jgi:hypothetical protein
MKKTYSKPVWVKRQQLATITAYCPISYCRD